VSNILISIKVGILNEITKINYVRVCHIYMTRGIYSLSKYDKQLVISEDDLLNISVIYDGAKEQKFYISIFDKIKNIIKNKGFEK